MEQSRLCFLETADQGYGSRNTEVRGGPVLWGFPTVGDPDGLKIILETIYSALSQQALTIYLRVPWTARRSNQSIKEEISPEYSLKGLMLKLQYFGHLMERTDSLDAELQSECQILQEVISNPRLHTILPTF